MPFNLSPNSPLTLHVSDVFIKLTAYKMKGQLCKQCSLLKTSSSSLNGCLFSLPAISMHL